MRKALTQNPRANSSRRERAWVLAAGLGGLLFGAILPVATAAPKITLVAPPQSARELEVRLRAELQAAGFEVQIAAEEEGTLPGSLERLAEREGSAAAILLVRPPGSRQIEIWISDRMTGKTLLRRVEPVPDSQDAGALLALRAVELLRGSLLELRTPHPHGSVSAPSALSAWLAPPQASASTSASAPASASASQIPSGPASAPVAPSAPPAQPAPPDASPAPRWFALAGVSILGGSGGVPIAVAPTLGGAWRPSPRWALEAQLEAPANSNLAGPEGITSVSQALFLLRLRENWGAPDWRLAPYLTAGAGVYRVSTKGNAVPPFTSSSDDITVFAGQLGLGGSLRISRLLTLLMEGTGTWVAPRPRIQFAGRKAASVAQPLWAGSLKMEVAFW